MLDGNGDFGRALPSRLEAALSAARAGHHVSLEALQGAVCLYIDELIAAGHGDGAIRQHVIAAFHEVDSDAHAADAGWNEARIDQLIALCRDRVK